VGVKPFADTPVALVDVEEVDVLLAQTRIEFFQVSGAVHPRLVPKGVTSAGALESLTLHVLEDQEQRRKPLLAAESVNLNEAPSGGSY
jgi:hypothetical protein